MSETHVTSADHVAETILRTYHAKDPNDNARYIGRVGPFWIVGTSEPDRAGTYFGVYDLWKSHGTLPERVARLTYSEGIALASLLRRPG